MRAPSPSTPKAVARQPVKGSSAFCREIANAGCNYGTLVTERDVTHDIKPCRHGNGEHGQEQAKEMGEQMLREIEQARSAVYWAACAVDEQSSEAKLALHAAKSFCADTFFMCAANMIQLHGGIGFTWEHDAHLFFKRARSIQTMLADGNWHREQVATMVLGEAA